VYTLAGLSAAIVLLVISAIIKQTQTQPVRVMSPAEESKFETAAAGAHDAFIGEAAYDMHLSLPDNLTCEVCGGQMDFVSIDLGYSCRNAECVAHMEGVFA